MTVGNQCHANLLSGKRPGTYFTAGWVGFRVGLRGCGKPRHTEIQPPDRPARNELLYRLRYPCPHLGPCTRSMPPIFGLDSVEGPMSLT